MGEYDDDYRPSVDERLRQGASDELEVVRLRAENERLKVELAEASARADEHADRLDVYWKETAGIRAQRREAQATIERVRELFARLVSDFRSGTALGFVSVHLDAMERSRRQGDALEKLAAKALASA